jgi:hypothetical protein
MLRNLHLLAFLAAFTAVRSKPDMLECNGLSQRIKSGAQIMGIQPKKVDIAEAPFTIHKLEGTGDGWTNFSILLSLSPGAGYTSVSIEATDNITLTHFQDTTGTGGKTMGKKCATQVRYNDPQKQLSK